MSVATRLLTMTGLAAVLAFEPRILLAEEVPPPAAPETEQAGPGEEVVVTATRSPRPIRDVAGVAVRRPLAALRLVAAVGAGCSRGAPFGLRAAARRGRLGGAFDAELLKSDGYPVVADYHRGAVDRTAPSEHGTINARVGGEVSSD